MAYDDTFVKDPDEVLDYTRVWELDGDTIAASTFIVPAGLTKDSETHDATTATVWLSGGTAFRTYIVTNRITTTGSRTFDRSWLIFVQER